jgi:hypothetical protein
MNYVQIRGLPAHKISSVHVKRGMIQSLVHRMNSFCHTEQDIGTELESAKKELNNNAYPGKVVASVINRD